jgi:REP element-mobilizing transposase RayT
VPAHLHRLDRVWIENPVYFITTCCAHRRPLLATGPVAAILIEEWHTARARHGWTVGRYVILPDHVHFFCASAVDAKPLAEFVGAWKQWTSKRLQRAGGRAGPVWQPEFFDHVLRSAASAEQKWHYVRDNPVRAGLVTAADQWPWQGEIVPL